MSAGSIRLEALEGKLAADGSSSDGPRNHPLHECLVVPQGRLNVEVAGDVTTLPKDDTCAADSGLPRRSLNYGDELARFMVAVTPPRLRDGPHPCGHHPDV
ncbi:cupin domain-containing protein [Georgenia sp. Z1491]|uniref:cupin domain-containing protein n=1 Tax=Georgenia sp. Z1491 TaxID=3416707 RepID=UPI003CF56D99